MSDLYALAVNATRELTPSELHGAICGLAVCCPDEFPLGGLLALVGVDAVTDEYSVESMVAASVESLLSEDFGFLLLLPDDSLELGIKLEGLADWCSAFLSGLAAGLSVNEVNSLEELPQEAQEIIKDFRAITDVDLADAQQMPSEDGEDDFMQLQEFVKVGVLLIMSLLNDGSGGSQDDPS